MPKKRITKKYAVTFRVEVDAPDEGDETPFIVEQDIRRFLEREMMALRYNRVKFGTVDDVGATEGDQT